jgi:hypothetical protein
MILACRVLRSSVGQGSCRSQRADGIFGTHKAAVHGRFKIVCGAWCGSLCPPAPAPGFPNSTAELFRQSQATLLSSSGTQE